MLVDLEALAPESTPEAHLNAALEAVRVLDPAALEAWQAGHADRFPPGPAAVWRIVVALAAKKPDVALAAVRDAHEAGLEYWQLAVLQGMALKQGGRLAELDAHCAQALQRYPQVAYLREMPKHARGYYAQAGQDIVIEQFFKVHAPRHRWFAEVGAFDGLHYSNVRRLVEVDHWTGVSVEPIAKNFAKLQASYRGSTVRCIQAAVADEEGTMDIMVSTVKADGSWGSDIATLHESETGRWQGDDVIWEKQPTPVHRLTKLLEDAGCPGLDLMSVDVEGADFDVIKSLDLSRFAPAFIVTEYSAKQRGDILAHLTAHGYRLLWDSGQDLFLTRTSWWRHTRAWLALQAWRTRRRLTGRSLPV